jgi:lipoprotein-releasing system permease protein
MPYEFLVGWRYLYSRRSSKAIWWALGVSSVLLAAGLVLFFYTSAKAYAAFMMLAGGLGMAIAALLTVFSTFTAISMLGVAIGVAILIWVLSVTSGFQEEFRKKVLGVNAHILILKYGLDFSEYDEVIAKAKTIPDVLAGSPFVFNEMMLARGQRLSGVLVKGVDPDRVGDVLDLPRHIVKPRRIAEGELSKFLHPATDAKGRSLGRPPEIIMGQDLAEKLALKVGDMVRLISPLSGLDAAGWTPAGEIPRSKDFRVAAIFFSGFNEYDRRLVYLHMREAQSFMEHGDVVTGVDLKIDDVFEAKPLARRVVKLLGGSPYRAIDWSELNHNLFTALSIQKLFLRIIIGFIVVVAAFNVLAALAVLVIRKTREIAVLKSLGMASRGIARVFMTTGLIVWFVGTGLGLLWGYLGGLVLRQYGFPLDPKVYHISELPVRMDPMEFLLTAVLALFWCMLLTLYPSFRASRMNPVEGLRYE